MKNKINISIVLVSPRNPLNIGAAARAMGNFGLKDLRVVSPFESTWQEAITAVGAHDILKKAKVFNTAEEAVADSNLVLATTSLKNRKPTQKVVSLPEAHAFLEHYQNYNIAIMFGQEKTGLTAKELELAHAILNIPTSVEVPSINLAQAVILCCYELSKTSAKPKKEAVKNTPAVKDYLLLEKEIEKLMDTLDFPPTVNEKIRHTKLREISQKMALSKENLFFIKTVISKILKK